MSDQPKPAIGEWTVKECEAFWRNEVKLLRDQLAAERESLRKLSEQYKAEREKVRKLQSLVQSLESEFGLTDKERQDADV